MNSENQNLTPEERPNLDGRIFGTNGEPDVFIARDFWPKLLFVVFSFLIFAFGIWEIWGPFSRLAFGEFGTARVIHLVRQSPGEADEIIRVRREIRQEDYGFDTLFRHFVEVLDQQGNPRVYEMAVASRQSPYALVNESFRVIYFRDDAYAYGMWHHRTWAMGLTFILMGLTLLPLAVYLLYWVGKPIVIDPEDPEQLRKEQEAEARDAEWHRLQDANKKQ